MSNPEQEEARIAGRIDDIDREIELHHAALNRMQEAMEILKTWYRSGDYGRVLAAHETLRHL